MRTHRRRLLILCVLGVACSSGDENPAPRDGVATEAENPADLTPTPHAVAATQATHLAGRDLGIGVLRFAWYEDRPRDGTADTILVRVAPQSDDPLVARFIYTFGASTDADAAWGWHTEATEPELLAADVEFDYEENGLPIDSTAGEWVRVIYATTPAGDPRTGWTRRRPNIDAMLWPSLFAERNLFFLDDVTPSFHTSPDGSAAAVRLARSSDAPGNLDYTMYPDSIAGPWMRVRVVTPSNYCFDPVNPAEHTVWIRFLDARGRPRIFYHSRGC